MNFSKIVLILSAFMQINSLEIDHQYCIVKNCYNCARAFQQGFGSKNMFVV